MNSILLRYFLYRLSSLIGFVLMVFMSFFLVFSFLERIGDENVAGTLQVLWDVILLIPELLQKLLPPCCAIGSAVALARLDRQRELLAMRLHGVKRTKIALWIAATSIVWLATYALTSEIGLAASAKYSRESAVRGAGSFLDHQEDLWIHQDSKYIRIKNISAGGRLLHRITEFTSEQGSLVEILDAHSAAHGEDGWMLRSLIMMQRDEAGQWHSSRSELMPWQTRLNPDIVASFNLAPDSLSMLQLAGNISRLAKADLPTLRFQRALWNRIADMLAIPLLIVMGLWAAGFAARPRDETVKKAAGLATAGAIVYYFSTVIVRQTGVEAGWPAPAGPLLPVAFIAALVALRLAPRKFSG